MKANYIQLLAVAVSAVVASLLTRTVAVRPDVDLTQRKVGEQVVIRITEMLALRMEKSQ